MKRLMASMIVFVFAWAAFAAPIRFDPDSDVSVLFKKGAVQLSVPSGVHLKVKLTDVALKEGQPGKLVTLKPASHANDELGEGIWRNTVSIGLKGENLKDPVLLVATYQPCTEGENGVCFPPTDRDLTVKASEIPALARQEIKAEASTPKPQAPSPEPQLPSPKSRTPTLGPEPQLPSSLFWLLVTAFGFGVVTSLTPCVYPMIPITMVVIGAKGGGKARGFVLSLVLVLGIAVTYTTLGVVTSLMGLATGSLAQHPVFLIPVSVLFALFALSLFGAFEIRLPDALQSKLQGNGPRKGLLGAFLMGMVLGPISAPCVGPILIPVLIAIGKQGQVFLGALQLFAFALGMGMLFVAVGTFSATLPRSGDWLVKLKQFMGLVVLAFAAWNIRFVVPEWSNYALWSIVLFTGAIIFGSFRPAEDLPSGFQKTIGILALSLGILLGLRAVEVGLKLDLLPRGSAIQKRSDPALGLWMEQDFEGALARAKTENKLLLIDTYAEWCAQCKELDEKTWPEPAVAAWIEQNAVAVRIDTYKVRKDLNTKLEILGYPTVILLDSNGKELRRLSGFQKPETMLAWLKD